MSDLQILEAKIGALTTVVAELRDEQQWTRGAAVAMAAGVGLQVVLLAGHIIFTILER